MGVPAERFSFLMGIVYRWSEIPSLKLTARPWKWGPPGKGDYLLETTILMAMLASRRVIRNVQPSKRNVNFNKTNRHGEAPYRFGKEFSGSFSWKKSSPKNGPGSNMTALNRKIICNLGCPPCPWTVTTRIIFFVGDPYKPSFLLLLGSKGQPRQGWKIKNYLKPPPR